MIQLKRLFAVGIAIAALVFITLNTATSTENTNLASTLNNSVLHVSATEAAQLLTDNANIKVLDVRTPFEYNRGHIAGAVQLNYYGFDFEQKLAALDKNTTWLVHCKSGVRSGKTLPLMEQAGFKSIIHLDGGINSWRAAKLPTTTAK